MEEQKEQCLSENRMHSSPHEYSFNHKIVAMILMFNVNEYPKYLRISAAWYCVINEALDEYTNHIENEFVKSYSFCFNFLKSYISATPI